MSSTAVFGMGAAAGVVAGAAVTALIMTSMFHLSLSGVPAAAPAVAAKLNRDTVAAPAARPSAAPTTIDDPAVALDPELDKQTQTIMAAVKQKQADDDRALSTPGTPGAATPATTGGAPGVSGSTLPPPPPTQSAAQPSVSTANPNSSGRVHNVLRLAPQ